MKVLHTSDWHLGATLYGRKRYDEYRAFLSWLSGTMQEQVVEALLVAGDIFDNSTPSNRAQEFYYQFLCRVAASPCRHVVIIGGNHDSASFLDAPRELLKVLNVHVVGSVTTRGEMVTVKDEIVVCTDAEGQPELIVCAVPYLRDRDIRTVEAGESIENKVQKMIGGIQDHYTRVIDAAVQKRDTCGRHVPLVVMGHLFTAGGLTVEGDGVRELYIGSLAHVPARIFPGDRIDYLALGHLHVPQTVNNVATMRYSGSPLPMGFGEANHRKSVCLIDMSERGVDVELVEVPIFQQLEQVRGSWEVISSRLAELSASSSNVWLEIIYDGDSPAGDLRERLDELIAGTAMQILRIRNNRIIERVLSAMDDQETLDDLDYYEVFSRCLSMNEVPEEQREALMASYREVVMSVLEEDSLGE